MCHKWVRTVGNSIVFRFEKIVEVDVPAVQPRFGFDALADFLHLSRFDRLIKDILPAS